jgi:hypothetical protein
MTFISPCSPNPSIPQSPAKSSPNPKPRSNYIPFRVLSVHSPVKGRSNQEMGDFVQQSITKTAVRELTTPIADITTFNTMVKS